MAAGRGGRRSAGGGGGGEAQAVLGAAASSSSSAAAVEEAAAAAAAAALAAPPSPSPSSRSRSLGSGQFLPAEAGTSSSPPKSAPSSAASAAAAAAANDDADADADASPSSDSDGPPMRVQESSPRGAGGGIDVVAAALDGAFDEIDASKTGSLTKLDLFRLFRGAADRINLRDVDDGLIEVAVEALLEDVREDPPSSGGGGGGGGGDGQPAKNEGRTITRMEFHGIFDRHPDLARAVFEEPPTAEERESSRQRAVEDVVELQRERKDDWEAWHRYNTEVRNRMVEYAWLLAYAAANAAVFATKAVKYADNREALAVFGNCVVAARGAAACLNLNCLLILLPVCRHLLTWFQCTPLANYFPFDAYLESHILIGVAALLFVVIHVSAHVCDFHRFSYADERDIYALFGDKFGEPVPESPAQRWLLLVKQPAGITGIIMVACMLVAYPTVLVRRKKFNVFWTTHHLLLVMLIALCCHGIGNLLEPFQSLYWVVGPLVVYVASRVLRETPRSDAKVVQAQTKQGGIVHLKLTKPPQWKHVRSGMYSFLKCPAVSRIEWHPFTLTSTPDDDYVEFHFAAVGDWTESVRSYVERQLALAGDDAGDGGSKDAKNSSQNNIDIEEQPRYGSRRLQPFGAGDGNEVHFKVDGPMGASSQGFSDYEVVVLVGAGIGITPMVSVVRYLLDHPGRMKKTYFYWTVRDYKAFEWFADMLDDIYEHDTRRRLNVYHFLTSVRFDDRDLGAVLLAHAANARHGRTDFDILIGRRTRHQIDVGRPDWAKELSRIKGEATDMGFGNCGIFLCGPDRMAKDINRTAVERRIPISTSTLRRKHFSVADCLADTMDMLTRRRDAR